MRNKILVIIILVLGFLASAEAAGAVVLRHQSSVPGPGIVRIDGTPRTGFTVWYPGHIHSTFPPITILLNNPNTFEEYQKIKKLYNELSKDQRLLAGQEK